MVAPPLAFPLDQQCSALTPVMRHPDVTSSASCSRSYTCISCGRPLASASISRCVAVLLCLPQHPMKQGHVSLLCRQIEVSLWGGYTGREDYRLIKVLLATWACGYAREGATDRRLGCNSACLDGEWLRPMRLLGRADCDAS